MVDRLGPLKLALTCLEAKTKTESGIRSTSGQLHFELAPKVVSNLKAESPTQLSLNGCSHVPKGEVCNRGTAVVYGSSQRIAHFAKGFVRLERAGDALRIADLRMGLTPGYVFRFEAGRFDGAFLSAIPTVRIVPQRSFDNDADWLFAGIAGTGVTRRIEAGAAMKLPNTGAFPSDQTVSAEC